MPEVSVVAHRAIVNLKVAKKDASAAADRLVLAPPLQIRVGDVSSLWLGPDTWLLTSDTQEAATIVEQCDGTLDGLLFNAVDYSSGLTVFRISGADARELLAAGSGLDLRPASFSVGACSRTRLAQIAVVVIATGDDEFRLYLDRSYEQYFEKWLQDNIAMLA